MRHARLTEIEGRFDTRTRTKAGHVPGVLATKCLRRWMDRWTCVARRSRILPGRRSILPRTRARAVARCQRYRSAGPRLREGRRRAASPCLRGALRARARGRRGARGWWHGHPDARRRGGSRYPGGRSTSGSSSRRSRSTRSTCARCMTPRPSSTSARASRRSGRPRPCGPGDSSRTDHSASEEMSDARAEGHVAAAATHHDASAVADLQIGFAFTSEHQVHGHAWTYAE